MKLIEDANKEALARIVEGEPRLTDRSPIAASTGATFTSPTWIVIVLESERAGVPLSVTRTVTP